MATPAGQLLLEVASGDVPKINLGNFNWRPSDEPVANKSHFLARGSGAEDKTGAKQAVVAPVPLALREEVAAPPLTAKAFPLDRLENKTFMGTGFNMIWRPRSNIKLSPRGETLSGEAAVPGGADDVLQFNWTAESMAFSKSIGEAVPNRGAGNQADIALNGLTYVQRVGAFENKDSGKADAAKGVGIHLEPGVFMFVPATDKNPKQSATLNRMASIPHGTTINAQGLVPSTTPIKGSPRDAKDGGIPTVDIFPFVPFPLPTNPKAGTNSPFGPAGTKIKEDTFPTQLTFNDKADDKLPLGWTDFHKNKTITQDTFSNPNEFLRKAIADQEIESFITFTLTTTPVTSKFTGGGTANIGFLEGSPANRDQVSGNAHAIKMEVTYWLETVIKTLTIQPGVSTQQAFQMVNGAGILGPRYIFPPTTGVTKALTKQVRWTQLQYSQNVTLNFNTLSWPHISVATLGETGTINLDLPAS